MLIGALRFVRGLAGFIGGWQIIGLLPVLQVLGESRAVAPGFWVLVGFKVIICALALGLFFGLRIAINKIHVARHGAPHPALTKAWNL